MLDKVCFVGLDMVEQGFVGGQGSVVSDMSAGIATVEFFHPQSNALPRLVLTEIAATIRRVSAKPECRVIILRSKGEKAFCAGASFDELLQVRTVADGEKFFSGFADVILAIRDAKQFVIARAQGRAAGGGVGLLAAADMVVASPSAQVRLSELAIGIGPFTIGPAVLRKVGVAAFSELSATAAWRDASWAQRVGLFTTVTQSTDQLDGAVTQLATELAQHPREATAKVRRMMWEGTEKWEELLAARVREVSTLVITTEAQAAIAAARKA